MMKSLLLAFTVLLVVTSSHVSLARVVDQTNGLHSTRRHGSSRTSASMGSVRRSVPAWSWLLQEVRGGGDAGVVPVGQPEDTTATMEDKWMGSSESTTPMDPDNPQGTFSVQQRTPYVMSYSSHCLVNAPLLETYYFSFALRPPPTPKQTRTMTQPHSRRWYCYDIYQ